jgi:hypothetical protein
MSVLVSLYTAILFFVLVPGVLLTLPRKGSKLTVAAVHAIVFGLIFHFTCKLVWRLGVSLEGFDDSKGSSQTAIESMAKMGKKKSDKEEDDDEDDAATSK